MLLVIQDARVKMCDFPSRVDELHSGNLLQHGRKFVPMNISAMQIKVAGLGKIFFFFAQQ